MSQIDWSRRPVVEIEDMLILLDIAAKRMKVIGRRVPCSYSRTDENRFRSQLRMT